MTLSRKKGIHSIRMPKKKAGAVPEEVLPYLAGDASLAEVKDAKTRRRLTRSLAMVADGEDPAQVKAAADALFLVLNADVRIAKPISKTLNASKRRDLLPKAWSRRMRALAEKNPPGTEIRSVCEWISKAAPELRTLEPDDATELLQAAVFLLASADRATLAARAPLIPLVAWLQNKVLNSAATVAETILNAHGSASHRRDVALGIAATNGLSESRMWQLVLEGAVYQYPEFGLYLLARMTQEERTNGLTRLLADASLREPRELANAARVLQKLCEDAGSQLVDYLTPLLELAIAHNEMPTMLQGFLTTAFSLAAAVQDTNRSPLVRTLTGVVDAKVQEATAQLNAQSEQLEETITSVSNDLRLARELLQEQEKLIDSLKRAEQRSRQLPEHAAKMSVLSPLCSVHQEMSLIVLKQPNQGLISFSRIIQSLLIRQGIKLWGTVGEVLPYDPQEHDWVEGSKGIPGSKVKVIAPGYRYVNTELDLVEVISRMAVSSA